MPKIKAPKLLTKDFMEDYNLEETQKSVLIYFKEYRNVMRKKDIIASTITSSLNSDSLGIFAKKLSDRTSMKVEKMIDSEESIKNLEKTFKTLKLKLTPDEKIIFEMAILSRHTDEDLAECLCLDKSNIYPRKKSCFLKVAIFYNIAIYKN